MGYAKFTGIDGTRNAKIFDNFINFLEEEDEEAEFPPFVPMTLFGSQQKGWKGFYDAVKADRTRWRQILRSAQTETQSRLAVFLEKRLREKMPLTTKRTTGYMRQGVRVEVTHEMVMRMGTIAYVRKVYRKRFGNASDEDIAKAIKPALDALKHGFITRISDLLGRP